MCEEKLFDGVNLKWGEWGEVGVGGGLSNQEKTTTIVSPPETWEWQFNCREAERTEIKMLAAASNDAYIII